MKILYLVSGLGPKAGWGTEYIQDLIISLSQKGIQGWIINPIYGHTHPNWRQWTNKLEKNYNLKIISLIAPKWISRNFILHLALTPIFVTMEIVKLCRKENFDIIHEFSSTPIILCRHLIMKILFKVPTLFTLSVYNNTLLGNFKWFKIFNFANYYLIPSREIINRLLNQGIHKDKIIFSPPGIDLSNFINTQPKSNARKILNIPSDKFVLTYFGSLTEEKGVTDLLKASLLINTKHINSLVIQLYVIWKGSPRHQMLIQKIKSGKYPLINLVEKYTEIPTLLAASDCVILPQQTGHGTTIPPISTIETIASKKPLITTNILGNRDFANFPNITIVPPKNPAKLAVAIVSSLKGKPWTKTSMDILRDYTINNSTDKHLLIYKDVLLQKIF